MQEEVIIPLSQPTTQRWIRFFGFTFGNLSCDPSSHTVLQTHLPESPRTTYSPFEFIYSLWDCRNQLDIKNKIKRHASTLRHLSHSYWNSVLPYHVATVTSYRTAVILYIKHRSVPQGQMTSCGTHRLCFDGTYPSDSRFHTKAFQVLTANYKHSRVVFSQYFSSQQKVTAAAVWFMLIPDKRGCCSLTTRWKKNCLEQNILVKPASYHRKTLVSPWQMSFASLFAHCPHLIRTSL